MVAKSDGLSAQSKMFYTQVCACWIIIGKSQELTFFRRRRSKTRAALLCRLSDDHDLFTTPLCPRPRPLDPALHTAEACTLSRLADLSKATLSVCVLAFCDSIDPCRRPGYRNSLGVGVVSSLVQTIREGAFESVSVAANKCLPLSVT